MAKKWGDNSTDDYTGKTADSLLYEAGYTTNYSTSYNGMGKGRIANRTVRTVIKFSIKDDLEALGANSITSATLYLYPYSIVGSHTISAYRILQNWVNDQVTWNSYDRESGYAWNTAGCAAASDAGEDDGSYDRKATAEASDASVTINSYSLILDITTLAQKWLAGTAKEYGVLLQSSNEDLNQLVRAYQVEAADTYRPYLEIDYVTTAIDLTAGPDTWYKDLRPKKFRMKTYNATSDVSLKDSNGVALYESASYASLDEVPLDFAGADINRLLVMGASEIHDIEFLVKVVKGSMPEQPPRTELPPRILPPDPEPERPPRISIPLRIPRKGKGGGGGRTGRRARR